MKPKPARFSKEAAESKRIVHRIVLPVMAGLASLVLSPPQVTFADGKKYPPGVTDTVIKIGQTAPYSGPASAFATIGHAAMAYFQKINDEGGVNGRKIRMISLDDNFSPPKALEQTRKLVEQEEVLLMFNQIGPGSLATRKYLNEHKVPQLFVGDGATEWDDPEHFPWSMRFIAAFEKEGRLFANYILKNRPKARVALLAENGNLGEKGAKGLKEGLGSVASAMIVSEQWVDINTPSIDSQVISVHAAKADVLVSFLSPRGAAQAIRKIYDIGWRPLHMIGIPASSVESVLKPAGLEKSVGIITLGVFKTISDPAWRNEMGVTEYLAWMKRYYPEGDPNDVYNVFAYSVAQTLIRVLQQCGNDLSRDNVMRHAANIRNLELPLFLPGIKINTSPTDYRVIEDMQFLRFDGERWVPLDRYKPR
jgi:branched-chain amino acid transport system substrate-binding protein